MITSTLPLDVVRRAPVDHATDGLTKLGAEESTSRLLAVRILAEGAGEVIQAAVMAFSRGSPSMRSPTPTTPTSPWPEPSSSQPKPSARRSTLSCCAACPRSGAVLNEEVRDWHRAQRVARADDTTRVPTMPDDPSSGAGAQLTV
ncbi:MAG: hypothetical protein KY394_05755 [Actinobacteria bacterium]|nr:hypothetical protein [Actinomycetota bacterium]